MLSDLHGSLAPSYPGIPVPFYRQELLSEPSKGSQNQEHGLEKRAAQ
jgi:hypothetical protein